MDHGIGVYKELAHLSAGGVENDFLLIMYQEGDKLYVPVDKLGKVQKYWAWKARSPRLTNWEVKSWGKAKLKAGNRPRKWPRNSWKSMPPDKVTEGHSFTPPDR